jgi:hypothetical protein
MIFDQYIDHYTMNLVSHLPLMNFFVMFGMLVQPKVPGNSLLTAVLPPCASNIALTYVIMNRLFFGMHKENYYARPAIVYRARYDGACLYIFIFVCLC